MLVSSSNLLKNSLKLNKYQIRWFLWNKTSHLFHYDLNKTNCGNFLNDMHTNSSNFTVPDDNVFKNLETSRSLESSNANNLVNFTSSSENYVYKETFQKRKNNEDWMEIMKMFLTSFNSLSEKSDFYLEPRLTVLKSRKNKSQMNRVRHFVDYRHIKAQGGSGGDGCISFLRVYRNPYAGPDGGDGGNGGHVIFKAVQHIRSLEHLDTVIKAEVGVSGGTKNRDGKSSSDKVIEVPVGTVFKRSGAVIASLEEEGAVFVGARGGAGGKGNVFFTTDIDQAPKVAEFGGEAESYEYDVELLTMADVGLIGFPNAGKSTLLRSISRARPKVAAYPFTTLNPYVGMIQYGDHQQLAVADIPGLLPGAHQNYGLGISFLRHIERCGCLLYVIDASQSEPWKQLDTLRFELEQYQPGLSNYPHAVVANKMDLPESKDNFEALSQNIDLPILPISAKLGQKLIPLLALIRLLVDHEKMNKKGIPKIEP